jgi:hypothetical protein
MQKETWEDLSSGAADEHHCSVTPTKSRTTNPFPNHIFLTNHEKSHTFIPDKTIRFHTR